VTAGGIERGEGFALHAGLVEVDENKGLTLSFAGQHDGVGCDVAIGDRDFDAREFGAVEAGFDGGW
jgi:hypothetical protein